MEGVCATLAAQRLDHEDETDQQAIESYLGLLKERLGKLAADLETPCRESFVDRD